VRGFLVALTVIDGLLFFPAAWVAGATVYGAVLVPAPFVMGTALLFFALPVFCIAAPFAAWKAYRGQREGFNVVGLALAPVVYAAFLLFFILSA
jgi:hypothetical protein